MSTADEPRTVDASRSVAHSHATDAAGPPPPVPDGFPEDRPPHDQVRPEIPEGEDGAPAAPGSKTHPGELMGEDDDEPEPYRSA